MDYIKRKQQPRHYVELGTDGFYSIFDRCDGNREVDSHMSYGDAMSKCDQVNKGDF